MPTCFKDTCRGHKRDSILPFTDLVSSPTSNKTRFSNIEFYDLIAPGNDAMPYVYDSIAYWPGCDDASSARRV